MKSKEFNNAYPIGTKVKYYPIIGGDKFIEAKTRSEAWELGSGHTIVKIDGRPGGVSVEALELEKK